MRKIVAISALTVLATGAVAAGVSQLRTPAEAMTADLERDLSLATSVPQTRSTVVSALEQGSSSAPSGEARGLRMVSPTKKRAPSPAPSRRVAEVAAAPSLVAPEAALNAPLEAPARPTSVAVAPSQSAVDAFPPDLSYPTPVAGGPSVGSGSENEHERGSTPGGNVRTDGHIHTDGSTTIGTVATIGTVVGAILRGGAAGHDNCEPQGRRNGLPLPTGTIGAVGGIILAGGAMPGGSVSNGPRPGGGARGRW